MDKGNISLEQFIFTGTFEFLTLRGFVLLTINSDKIIVSNIIILLLIII